MLAALIATIVILSTGGPGARGAADCIYSSNDVLVLRHFEHAVNRSFSCAVLFNTEAVDWTTWQNPWFLGDGKAGSGWRSWIREPGPHHQLIVTQGLIPTGLKGSDWLRPGAAGAFVDHARVLAERLVSGGAGDAVIRLGHEANDTSQVWDLGTTPRSWALWRQVWRNTVIAMRSVPGAHFVFDWCVNPYYRPIPLAAWYPGDDVVDVIGLDAYDAGVPVGQDRWTRLFTQPDGIGAVLAFAKAHHKPVSLPEWGLWPTGTTLGTLGGGDDPAYVNDIANLVRKQHIAYQSYFYGGDSRRLLDGSRSLSAYRHHFGGGGDTVGAATVSLSH